jgi:hypothetical protein
VIDVFKLFKSSWFNFGRSCVLRNSSASFCSINFEILPNDHLNFIGIFCNIPLSSQIFFIKVFLLLLVFWLKAYLYCLSFQRISSLFHQFIVLPFGLHFINFSPIFIISLHLLVLRLAFLFF